MLQQNKLCQDSSRLEVEMDTRRAECENFNAETQYI